MSTKDERRWRAQRFIHPIRVTVRQKDGTQKEYRIDADVREDKRRRPRDRFRDER